MRKSSLCLSILFAFLLTSCRTIADHSEGDSSKPTSSSIPSARNYATEWSYDDEVHYHACIDPGYEDLRADEAAHHLEVVSETPATFEAVGSKTIHCTICPYTTTEEIPIREHTYSSEYLDIDDAEYHYQACLDEGYSDLTKKTPHDFEVTVVPATYEADGYTDHTCKQCHYSYHDNIQPQLIHHYGDEFTYDAEYHYRECLDAGYEDKPLKEAHTMAEAVVQPTYDEDGYTRHYCTAGCGYEYHTDTVPHLEHTFAEEWSFDDTYHWHACLDAGFEELRSEEGRHDESGAFGYSTYPSYDEPGWTKTYCDVCGHLWKIESDNNQLTHGLVMTLNNEKNGYIVTGTTSGLYAKTTVPATHNLLPVVEIGNNAFKNSAVTEVTLPDSITRIGADAFVGTSLAKINFPEGLQAIGDSAFKGTRLTELNLPSTLLTIGEKAFANTLIDEVYLPDSLVEIGFAAFAGCYSISKMSLPFFGATKDIPAENNTTGTLLGHYFGNDSYEHSYKETQYYGLGLSADFYFPVALDTVIIRGGTHIPHHAFWNTHIVTVYLPDTLVAFDTYAFFNMPLIANIYYEGDITDWASIDCSENVTNGGSSPLINVTNGTAKKLYLLDEDGQYAFEGKTFSLPSSIHVNFCEHIPAMFVAGLDQITSIVIDEGVTSIGDGAFRNLVNLVTLEIPGSVTYIGSSIIYGCQGLVRLSFGEGSTPIANYLGGLKQLNTLVLRAPYSSLLGDSFNNDDGTSIQQYAADNDQVYYRGMPSNLREITIVGGSIPLGYFSGCTPLRTVHFGGRVTGYGLSLFRSCANINRITFVNFPYEGANDMMSSKSLGKLISKRSASNSTECIQLKPYNKNSPQNYWYVGNYTNEQIAAATCYIPNSLRIIEIANGYIGHWALANLKPVTEMDFGAGVTLAGWAAIECPNLETIYLHGDTAFDGDHVFDSCENLQTIFYEGTEAQFNAIKANLGINLNNVTVTYI